MVLANYFLMAHDPTTLQTTGAQCSRGLRTVNLLPWMSLYGLQEPGFWESLLHKTILILTVKASSLANNPFEGAAINSSMFWVKSWTNHYWSPTAEGVSHKPFLGSSIVRCNQLMLIMCNISRSNVYSKLPSTCPAPLRVRSILWHPGQDVLCTDTSSPMLGIVQIVIQWYGWMNRPHIIWDRMKGKNTQNDLG